MQSLLNDRQPLAALPNLSGQSIAITLGIRETSFHGRQLLVASRHREQQPA